MDLKVQSVDEIVEEITKIHRSLPTRPDVDDIVAARSLIRNVEKEEQSRLESISRNTKMSDVPDELFNIHQEMRKIFLNFTSKENKREALRLLDHENIHSLFDGYVQRASKCISSSSESNDNPDAEASIIHTGFPNLKLNVVASSTSPTSTFALSNDLTPVHRKGPVVAHVFMTKDDSHMIKKKQCFFEEENGGGSYSPKLDIHDTFLSNASISGRNQGEKLSLIKLASLIEVYARNGALDLSLHNMLLDDVDWIPDSIGKLSNLVNLDLSNNKINVLPGGIGGLSSLKNLNLHSNLISELPDSMIYLMNLTYLNLSCNNLTYLPDSIGRLGHLHELDISSNIISNISNSIGSLTRLNKLNLDYNKVEEIPYNIGDCISLKELRLEYNKLRALPEALGRVVALELLSVRYNNIKLLPSTMHNLVCLRELNVSFNELESVPERFCFSTSLVKMNIGNNFSAMQSLPLSIGNLEMLEELDISNNQIRTLPDSFRMLSHLLVLEAEGNPLEFPPRILIGMGAQAVVRYMAEHTTNGDEDPQPRRRNRSRAWSRVCLFLRPNRLPRLRYPN